jgi:enoyl-CoA hydratase/carnithine racemase
MRRSNLDEVLYDLQGSILTLTLSRPEALNAYTTTMHRQLLDALDRADRDDTVRAVILTGSGRAFCAGADLAAGTLAFTADGSGAERSPLEHRDPGGELVMRLLGSLKPIIAAVNGPAVGIGASMILAADVRVAASTAKVGFVFTRRGISPDGCSTWLLPRMVGMRWAQDWLLSGRMFPASEGLDAGLFQAVLEPEELLQEARLRARELIEGTSAAAQAVTRLLLWRNLATPDPMAAHKAESRALTMLAHAADAEEGVRAFLEKRQPRFTLSPPAIVAALSSLEDEATT